MSNPITDKTMNIVMKVGPTKGWLSIAPVPTDTVTGGGRRRFKVIFARKPFSYGEIVRGTLDHQILHGDSEGIGALIAKAVDAYFTEHPHDRKVWYDELTNEE